MASPSRSHSSGSIAAWKPVTTDSPVPMECRSMRKWGARSAHAFPITRESEGTECGKEGRGERRNKRLIGYNDNKQLRSLPWLSCLPGSG